MGNEISLLIVPQNIFLSVKPNIKVGSLRKLIALKLDITLEELIIEIGGFTIDGDDQDELTLKSLEVKKATEVLVTTKFEREIKEI